MRGTRHPAVFQPDLSNVEKLTPSSHLVRLVIFAACAALVIQLGCFSAGKPQISPAVLAPCDIVRKAVAATERSWQIRAHYTYIKRDEDWRLDAQGQIKSVKVDVSKMVVVNGEHFEQLLEHDGRPLSDEEVRKRDQSLEKLKHESSAEAARLQKERGNKELLAEVLQAFDFQMVGEEKLGDRAAYVLQVTPRTGYHPQGKYGKMLSKVQGKLWVDKQDFGWIKFDGQVTDSFALGLFVARVQRGSRLTLEQLSLGDAVWLPKRIELRAGARVLFVKNFDVHRILTYSDYRLADDLYSVSR
jgi:hypothetical protein